MEYEYIMHINNIHVYLFTCILWKYTQVRDVLYTEYLRLWTQVNPDLAVFYIHRALLRIYRALFKWIGRKSAVVDPSESGFGSIVHTFLLRIYRALLRINRENIYGCGRGGWQISSVSVVLSKFFWKWQDLDPTQFHRMGSTPTWQLTEKLFETSLVRCFTTPAGRRRHVLGGR